MKAKIFYGMLVLLGLAGCATSADKMANDSQNHGRMPAETPQIPVASGRKAQIQKVWISGSTLYATVGFNEICTRPDSFVTFYDGQSYSVYEAHEKRSGVACMAISAATQDISVGQVPDNQKESISVNGMRP